MCGCFIVKMVFLLYLSISVTSVDTINLFNQKNKQIFNSNNKNSFSHLWAEMVATGFLYV